MSERKLLPHVIHFSSIKNFLFWQNHGRQTSVPPKPETPTLRLSGVYTPLQTNHETKNDGCECDMCLATTWIATPRRREINARHSPLWDVNEDGKVMSFAAKRMKMPMGTSHTKSVMQDKMSAREYLHEEKGKAAIMGNKSDAIVCARSQAQSLYFCWSMRVIDGQRGWTTYSSNGQKADIQKYWLNNIPKNAAMIDGEVIEMDGNGPEIRLRYIKWEATPTPIAALLIGAHRAIPAWITNSTYRYQWWEKDVENVVFSVSVNESVSIMDCIQSVSNTLTHMTTLINRFECKRFSSASSARLYNPHAACSLVYTSKVVVRVRFY